jgi:hypothetical protein
MKLVNHVWKHLLINERKRESWENKLKISVEMNVWNVVNLTNNMDRYKRCKFITEITIWVIHKICTKCTTWNTQCEVKRIYVQCDHVNF